MSSVIDLANRTRPHERRPFLGPLLVSSGVVILLIAMFGASLFAHLRLFLAQYSDDFYAVYLENGNAVYGHVRGAGLGQLILSDAYSFQQIEVGETTTSNLSALRDNPLTRPDNWMVIPSRHILFYERIGDDASVLEALRAR